MPERTFNESEASARERGFDEIIERRWAPDTGLETHAHPFAVEALVIEGEMWLISAEGERHLRLGDRFSVPHSVPHGERYGTVGATVSVARRYSKEKLINQLRDAAASSR